MGQFPLVRKDGNTRELPAGIALDGTCNDILLLTRQATLSLLTLGSDTLLDGSVYLWEKDILPSGRKVYFEIVGAGANVSVVVNLTVSLYTVANVLVPGSTLTVSSLTQKRIRSGAISLADNTEYVVKYQTSGLTGTVYLYSARLILR